MADGGSGRLRKSGQVTLAYGPDVNANVLTNLSGCAVWQGNLWTVSDEGRSLECLEQRSGGFHLIESVFLDTLLNDLPGEQDGDEVDLEAISADDGYLWICGSHSKARRRSEGSEPSLEIRNRRSRRLFARLKLNEHGNKIVEAMQISIGGFDGLREALEHDDFIAPFAQLPTKENGIDIEGLAVRGERVFIGLRGPVIEGMSLLFELSVNEGLAASADVSRHFVNLGGLGIRDLQWQGDDLLILAGPMGAPLSPFQIYKWRPGSLEAASVVYSFPASAEKPEGLCWINKSDRRELMVLYDGGDPSRVKDKTYIADLLTAIG